MKVMKEIVIFGLMYSIPSIILFYLFGFGLITSLISSSVIFIVSTIIAGLIELGTYHNVN